VLFLELLVKFNLKEHHLLHYVYFQINHLVFSSKHFRAVKCNRLQSTEDWKKWRKIYKDFRNNLTKKTRIDLRKHSCRFLCNIKERKDTGIFTPSFVVSQRWIWIQTQISGDRMVLYAMRYKTALHTCQCNAVQNLRWTVIIRKSFATEVCKIPNRFDNVDGWWRFATSNILHAGLYQWDVETEMASLSTNLSYGTCDRWSIDGQQSAIGNEVQISEHPTLTAKFSMLQSMTQSIAWQNRSGASTHPWRTPDDESIAGDNSSFSHEYTAVVLYTGSCSWL